MKELTPGRQNESCLDHGQLLALRDGELTLQEEQEGRAHLAQCGTCRTEEQALSADSKVIYTHLDALNPETEPDVEQALHRLKQKQEQKPVSVPAAHVVPPAVMLKARRKPAGWLVAAVAATLLVVFALTPSASVLADQFLSLFRVQQFQAVSIDPTKLDTAFLGDLASIGTLKFDQQQKGPLVREASRDEAAKAVDFPLLQPSYVPANAGKEPKYSLTPSEKATFTFDANKTRAYLQKSGQGNVAIPAKLEGAQFHITVKSGVVTSYTNACATGGQDEKCKPSGVFVIAQVPSPVIQASGKATLQDLRDFVVSLPKLSPQLRDILQKIDLEKGTIPVPVPPQVRTQQVSVQNASGILIAEDSYKISAVLWQKNDIIYAVGLEQANGQEALKVAQSLH